MSRLIKPQQWVFNSALVAPEWGWFWRDVRHAIPLWEGQAAPYDFGNKESLTFVGDVTWQGTQRGPGIDLPGTNDYLTSPTTWYRDGEGSTFSYINLHDASASVILEYESDGTGSGYDGNGGPGTFREINLNYSSTNVVFHWQDGSDTNDRTIVETGAGLGWSDNENHSLGASWKDGGTHFLYADGLSVASTASDAPYDNITPTEIRYGAPGNLTVDREFNGELFCQYSFNRQLTDSEFKQLHDDPFGPFRMADEVGPVVAVGGDKQTGIIFSVLGPGAYPRPPYGSFAGKSAGDTSATEVTHNFPVVPGIPPTEIVGY